MRKYDWSTGQYIDEEVRCDGCGEVIESTSGYKVGFEEDENGEKVKVTLGSCCAGKIRAYSAISSKLKSMYQERGQIPESVLSKLPKAPPPDSNVSNHEAGRQVHEFIDKIGRSKLGKTMEGRIKAKKKK